MPTLYCSLQRGVKLNHSKGQTFKPSVSCGLNRIKLFIKRAGTDLDLTRNKIENIKNIHILKIKILLKINCRLSQNKNAVYADCTFNQIIIINIKLQSIICHASITQIQCLTIVSNLSSTHHSKNQVQLWWAAQNNVMGWIRPLSLQFETCTKQSSI